ncbi:MAG: glycosyltransferase family 39 protein [Candidatus Acidiferrales bacterium]
MAATNDSRQALLDSDALKKSTNFRKQLLLMVLAALAIRLAVAAFVYPERMNPARDHWRFAGEAGRIARSVAEGRGYSSPLFADTGPTSWLAPVFPFVLAGIFKVFGVYTKASLFAILGVDCLFSALTCIPVFFIAQKSFGDRVALWSGWAWALFPYSIYFAADFVWDTTLTTFLLCMLFLIVLHLERSSRLSDWIGFGALAGVAALTNPVVMSVLPLLAAWMCYRRRLQGQRWLAPSAGAMLAVLVVVSPWFIRNYRAFHKFIPFRGGIGLEFYRGNNKDDWHREPPGYHPSDSDEEWKEFQRLGEVGYFEKKQAQAFAFIGSHRGLYAVMTLRRIVYLWTGFWSFGHRYLEEEPMDPPGIFLTTGLTILTLFGLRRAFRDGVAVAMPYIIVLGCYPLAYYLTHPEDYYRRPIDPMFVILAVYAVARWKGEKTPEFSE